MLKARIQNNWYNLPTSWEDVTIERYIKAEKAIDKVSVICGLDLVLSPEEQASILSVLSFLNEDIVHVTELPNLDILDYSFAHWVNALTLIEQFGNENNYLGVLPYIQVLYSHKEMDFNRLDDMAEKMMKESCVILGLAYDAMEQIAKAENEHSAFAKQFNVPLTRAHKAAGYEESGKRWGWYNAVKQLAHGKAYRLKDVYDMTTVEALTFLKNEIEYNYRAYKYQKEVDRDINEQRNKKK